MRSFFAFLVFSTLLLNSGCMNAYKKSVGGDTEKVFSRIFLTDFNTAWQSILDSLKSAPLDISNRESGYVRTKWIDNTSEKNFIDSFGPGKFYLKAQYRFQITAAKGFYDGQPSVKVSVQKEQLVQSDVLEGWRPRMSDGIDEQTLLYRVGRIVTLRIKIAKIEEESTRQEIEESF